MCVRGVCMHALYTHTSMCRCLYKLESNFEISLLEIKIMSRRLSLPSFGALEIKGVTCGFNLPVGHVQVL